MSWGRAVKARRRWTGSKVPPLWVFTDQKRLPDPRAVLAKLPKGLCGVVLRAGWGLDAGIAAGVARICRQRRFALVVAGDAGLAFRLRAGRHMSRGAQRRAGGTGLMTASAHGPGERARAARLQADAVFLSPIFATASHPGAAGLGVVRWASMARGQHRPVLALGGVNSDTARRLPRFCAGAGVIGAAGGLVFSDAAG
jgi:thiamine-phosphate pyrophosphorylase